MNLLMCYLSDWMGGQTGLALIYICLCTPCLCVIIRLSALVLILEFVLIWYKLQETNHCPVEILWFLSKKRFHSLKLLHRSYWWDKHLLMRMVELALDRSDDWGPEHDNFNGQLPVSESGGLMTQHLHKLSKFNCLIFCDISFFKLHWLLLV